MSEDSFTVKLIIDIDEKSFRWQSVRMLTDDYLQRFSDSLVDVINAERGKRGLSFRGLAGELGLNLQYLTYRIGGGNSRTGKRTPISVADLEMFGEFFGVDPADILEQARHDAMSPERAWTPIAIMALEAVTDEDETDLADSNGPAPRDDASTDRQEHYGLVANDTIEEFPAGNDADWDQA